MIKDDKKDVETKPKAVDIPNPESANNGESLPDKERIRQEKERIKQEKKENHKEEMRIYMQEKRAKEKQEKAENEKIKTISSEVKEPDKDKPITEEKTTPAIPAKMPANTMYIVIGLAALAVSGILIYMFIQDGTFSSGGNDNQPTITRG
jgi:hypothetical protein